MANEKKCKRDPKREYHQSAHALVTGIAGALAPEIVTTGSKALGFPIKIAPQHYRAVRLGGILIASTAMTWGHAGRELLDALNQQADCERSR